MNSYISLAICILGALIYALCANPKAAELGRLMFWVGLLVWLFKGPVIG